MIQKEWGIADKERYVVYRKVIKIQMRIRVYHITKFYELNERIDELLTEPVRDKKRMNDIKFWAGIYYGFNSNLDCSHLHGDKKCVNPKNIDPEANSDNQDRDSHKNAETCNCESKGLSKCVWVKK